MPKRSGSLRPLRIVVLLGGHSEEREISLASGKAVADALASRGHRVIQFDPAAEIPDPSDVSAGEVAASRERLLGFDWSGVDAVFNALHGRFGEDGQVQKILADIGIPCTGSDAAASRLSFSKSASKERFSIEGIPTPAYRLVHRADPPALLAKLADAIGYPLVVKPDQQGSSLGVSIARDPDALRPALERCFQLGDFGLLERYIPGTEWTVPVFDREPLPLIRIDTAGEFYDFDSKYRDERTRYQLAFSAPPDVLSSIEQIGVGACRALGTRGIARVDLRLDEHGHAWVLEVNTSPGMTDHSLVPKSAAQAGWTLGELCETTVLRTIASTATRAGNAA